jgi:hypothetical protein
VRIAYLPDPVRGSQNKRGHRKPVPLFFGRLMREPHVQFKHLTVQVPPPTRFTPSATHGKQSACSQRSSPTVSRSDSILFTFCFVWSSFVPESALLPSQCTDASHERGIQTQDILDDALVTGGFTVLCIPGAGFASSFVSRLGSHGELKIVAFVKAGGGLLGTRSPPPRRQLSALTSYLNS